MKINNIREITKKEKIRGLSRNAWIITMLISGSLYPHIVFWSFLLFIVLLGFFYVIEFFDDDIIEVTINRFKYGGKNEYFA